MAIRKIITVTLTTRGDMDLPCTASCPDLALSTDGPTVAAALQALAKAMEYVPRGEELPAPAAPAVVQALPEPPPNPPGVILKALGAPAPALTSRTRKKKSRRTAPVLRAS